jgi:hypothetical protein
VGRGSAGTIWVGGPRRDIQPSPQVWEAGRALALEPGVGSTITISTYSEYTYSSFAGVSGDNDQEFAWAFTQNRAGFVP